MTNSAQRPRREGWTGHHGQGRRAAAARRRVARNSLDKLDVLEIDTVFEPDARAERIIDETLRCLASSAG